MASISGNKPIEHKQLSSACQRQLDADCAGCATCAQDDESFAWGVKSGFFPQTTQKAFAVRVLANQLVALTANSIHRADHRRIR
jgi:hypothetical protein